jgi:hypothetical protein
MEAISSSKPRQRRQVLLREVLGRRRHERALRAHQLRASGIRVPSVPGSEHTHLMLPPKAY